MVRPTKTHEPDATVTVGLRISGDLKGRLERAAAAEDRTLSGECERRLRRSLDPVLLGQDALKAMKSLGNIDDLFVFHFVLEALANSGSGRDAALQGIRVATTLGAIKTLEHGAPGAKVQIRKSDLDAIKTLVREIEKECVIVEGDGAPQARIQDYLALSDAAQQAYKAIATRGLNGEWKANAPLPSEDDLARDLGVGPKDVRQAIDLLERQGLIHRGASSKKGAVLLFPTARSA
jgi:hypothetical protein